MLINGMLSWLDIRHSNVELLQYCSMERRAGKILVIRMLSCCNIGHWNVELVRYSSFEC